MPTVKEYMKKEVVKRMLSRHKRERERIQKENAPVINTNLEKKRTLKKK